MVTFSYLHGNPDTGLWYAVRLLDWLTSVLSVGEEGAHFCPPSCTSLTEGATICVFAKWTIWTRNGQRVTAVLYTNNPIARSVKIWLGLIVVATAKATHTCTICGIIFILQIEIISHQLNQTHRHTPTPTPTPTHTYTFACMKYTWESDETGSGMETLSHLQLHSFYFGVHS